MRRSAGRPRPLRSALASAVLLSLLVGGCGGGGSDDASADDDAATTTGSTTSTTVPTSAERPEGAWTFVLTTLARDDSADLTPGTAEVRLTELEPDCEAGPCDLAVTPAGADGSYLPEGVASRDEPGKEPATYTWDAAKETYTRVNGPRKESCTNVDGKVIDDAYTATTTATVTFRAADGDRPASLTGTYVLAVEATEAGLAQQCTPYREEGSVVGTPTGALLGADGPDLAGSYITTEVVTETEPSGQREPGFTGLLGTFVLEAAPKGYAAKGLLGTATLGADGDGWSGTTPEVEQACQTTPETPEGYTSVETFDGLAPVALTEDGDPILAGGWGTSDRPTEAGVAAGCSFSSNTGYVVLVPTDAVG